jgi:outer membrane protein OmpA-like peptidoglycan-associated protein
MAVSQFLRPGSLMDAIKGYLTPDAVRSASALVGESETSTRQTLSSAVPTVLSGLTSMVGSREGITNFGGLIRDGGFGSAVDNVGSLFSGGSTTSNMLGAGQQLLGKVFPGKTGGVTDLLARVSGVSSSSAGSLLSLAAPLVMGVLGKRAAAQGLDSSGLANVLLNEKSDIAAAAPSGLSQLLTGGPTVVSRSREVVTETTRTTPPDVRDVRREPYINRYTPEVRRPGLGRWLPLLLIALGALALLMLLRPRTPRAAIDTATSAARNALSTLRLPGGGSISVLPGSLNYNLAQFLDGAEPAPKTFVFDHLNFQTGSAQLTADSTQTVNDLAAILKAYPNAQVQLSGHTDNTGSADANQTLSLDRANAIKAMLVSQGVAAQRISTQGFGQDRPIASNDTDEGRARNRRTELTVTSK